MKRLFGIVLGVGFLSVAVFGFFGMDSVNGHMHESCIAITAQGGGECSTGSTTGVDSALFHAGAYKSFSLAVMTVLFALVGIATVVFSQRHATSSEESRGGPDQWRRAVERHYLSQRRQKRWLTLHEMRDAHALFAACGVLLA